MKLELMNVLTATGLGTALTSRIKRLVFVLRRQPNACHASRGFRVHSKPHAPMQNKMGRPLGNMLPSADTRQQGPGRRRYRTAARAVFGKDVPNLDRA